MEANQPERQENVRATRSLSCDSRLRRRHACGLVSIRRPGRASANRRATHLSQGGAVGRRYETLENHVSLRRSQVPRARCRQSRAEGGTHVQQESRARSRRGLPGRFSKDGRGAGMAVVRDAGHVPKGRLRNGRAARDERGSHEENDPAATLKETLIEGPGYSASRAGRSAGRSLSWHGRGRGFKSHPVHFSVKGTVAAVLSGRKAAFVTTAQKRRGLPRR